VTDTPDLDTTQPINGGATYSLSHRLFRIVWGLAWLLLASWTPPPLRNWRRQLLILFGAKMGVLADVRGSARVWHPGNLEIGDRALISERVNCYNLNKVVLETRALVSQDAVLLGGGHDIDSPNFDLITKPIRICEGAWVAAGAVVGAGVTVHPYAVLGAYSVAFRDIPERMIYVVNPAKMVRQRADWPAEAEASDRQAS
jgi:putative colanic acid biosynthesis acetyltransferase WcaF